MQLALWLPIAFVYYYLGLVNSQYANAEFLGKKLLSGREQLYQLALERWDDIWLGDLTRFRFDNFHNSHLTILVNLGIIGFVLYIFQTNRAYNALYKECNSIGQQLSAIAIALLFVMGCAEAAVLTGGTMYFIYMLTFVVLANSSDDESDCLEEIKKCR